MKIKLTILAIVFLLISGALLAIDIDEEKILVAIDEQRNFDDIDFSSMITVIQEDPEEGVEKMVVQQFRRDNEDKFVFLFLEPVVQKGQGYLRIEDNLWFYDPESRKFSHTSMKEQFGGTDARNSDFGASTMIDDYRILSIEEGTLGKYKVYILELEARHDEVTYPKQKVWVTRDRYLVLKTEDYSETGRLLRKSLYPNYAKAGDQYIASTLIFVDELVEGKKTSISLAEISLSPLPDSVFTKTYIERVNR
jgi:outer membrane lipoprotein-sorting protein